MTCSSTTVYQNAIGLNVKISTGQDLSTIDLEDSYYRVIKPSGVEQTWEVEVYGDAPDGILLHETVEDDLDEYGEYLGQAIVTFEDGRRYYGAVARFTIMKNEVTLDSS